ncbi:MAG: DUF6340 family protein [Bacteroides sp.]|nr:DUF6340 family protein [Bacteroides sp.]
MTKYAYYLLLCCSVLLSGCQTMEPLSIDYMLPAEISFPESLRRVAIVNNMPEIPDNELIIPKEDKKDETEIARKMNYYNGNAAIATEALAEAIANENYFNEVVICDSVLRAKDITPRESTLTEEEASQLIQDLDVDFLVALENVQIRSTRKISFMRDWDVFYGTVDAKVYPTVKVYLPNRKTPMVTISANDSIFWDEAGNEPYVQTHLISDKEVIRQASEFAGSIPVKHLLPYWKTANRYLFSGGSANMRDAAVYAKENKWDKAIELWKQTYDTQKGKKKMQAAYNIAVGYEMQDSIIVATDWALKAQAEARKVDKVDERDLSHLERVDLPNYVLTTLYVAELQERRDGLSRLKMQMQRFSDDF